MQTRVADAATTTAATALPEGAPSLPPRISWGAVFAGAIVAVTVGTMLNVLGLAIGATSIDATAPGDTPAASTFGITAGVWLLVANLIGLAVGGYVAARLSGTADGTDGILHGLSVWAVGFLISAVLLGNIIAGTTSTAFNSVSNIVGGVASGAGSVVQGAGQAAGGAAQAAGPQLAQQASQINPQALIERFQSALRTGGDPAQMTSEQRNAEIADIARQRVTGGDLPPQQRDRLNQLIAAEYNISPQEAQQRVQQVEQQAQQTLQQAEQTAREAANAAATGAAVAAYWVFAAMLLGAVAAVLGARMGTRNAVTVRERRYA